MLSLFESIAKLIEQFLELKVLKEKDKYKDQLLSLQTDWRAEYNKPIWDGKDENTDASHFRNDAALYDIFCRLRDLTNAITSTPSQ